MKYEGIVSRLVATGNDIHMLLSDGIADEMILLRDSVLPSLDIKETRERQLLALATIFRSCSKHAAIYEDCGQYTLWQRMEEMYNADYGDSWSKELDMFGILCMHIRTYEKLNRVITITPHGAHIKDEKTSDTLQDICNDCVMTAMWILNKSNNNEQE